MLCLKSFYSEILCCVHSQMVSYCCVSSRLRPPPLSLVQHTIFFLFRSLVPVLDSRCFSTVATPCAGLALTRNDRLYKAIMAANAAADSPDRRFRLGNSVFTCGEARQCYLLLRQKVTVRQIQELYHPNASLKEIVAAIQIGIQFPDRRLDDLCPAFFDVEAVVLEMWNIGYQIQTRASARKCRAARPNELE